MRNIPNVLIVCRGIVDLITEKKNIPNILTGCRGLLTLVIIVLFRTELYFRFPVIFVLFTIACITDFLDGYLSRKWEVTSKIGMILDPRFDKLLVLSLIFLIYPLDVIPFWILIILFLRDLTTDAFKDFILQRIEGNFTIKSAKVKAVFQMLMIGSALLYLSYPVIPYFKELSFYLGIIAVYFSLHSGILYLKKFLEVYNVKKIN